MKISDILTNISGYAAVAIIICGVGGFFAVIITASIGRQLTPEALALIDRFISILIGLAVGAGAGGSALALRAVNLAAAQNVALQQRPQPPMERGSREGNS